MDAAQCGLKAAPRTPSTAMRSCASDGPSQRTSSWRGRGRARRRSGRGCAGLGRRRRQGERAALGEVAVDVLLVGDPADLVDGVDHRPVHRDRAVASVLAGGQLGRLVGSAPSTSRRCGPTRRTPRSPPRARRCAATGRLAQVVGRPEARVAGADDGDVGVAVAGQRRRGARSDRPASPARRSVTGRTRRRPSRSGYAYTTTTVRAVACEVRHLLRAAAAQAVGARRRVRAAPERARPDRAGRPPRLRLRVGGRAPLPRGVQPLLGARGVPRPRPASARTNIRLGHGIVQLTDEPPGAGRRAGEHARPASATAASSWASARARASPSCTRSTAASATSASVWEDAVRCLMPMFWDGGLGVPRRVLRLPAAQRRAQAAASSRTRRCGWRAASSTRSRWPAGAASARSASSSCRAEAAHGVGERLLQRRTPSSSSQLGRLPDQPEHRRRQRVHVRADRRGGAAPSADGWTFFQFALRFYNDARPGRAGHASACGTSTRRGRQSPQGRSRAARRAHRLAGDDPRSSCASSRRPTSTRSSCSTRPARNTPRATSARASSCSPPR